MGSGHEDSGALKSCSVGLRLHRETRVWVSGFRV